MNGIEVFLSDEPFITRVCVYKMIQDEPMRSVGLCAALGDTLALPNIMLEGLWERLIFIEDWRDTMIRIVSNMSR